MIHRFFATLVTGLFVLGGLVTAVPRAAFTTSALDGARDDFAASIVRAPDALYVAGRSASKTIGGWPVATGGVPEAAVLARYSLSGDLDWVSALPGDAGAAAAATAVTPQGSIYVAGTYVRAADSQVLIAKYDAAGAISKLASLAALEARRPPTWLPQLTVACSWSVRRSPRSSRGVQPGLVPPSSYT